MHFENLRVVCNTLLVSTVLVLGVEVEVEESAVGIGDSLQVSPAGALQ